MLLFDYTIRTGAILLNIVPVSSDANVKAWTVINDQTIRIVLINKTPNACQVTIKFANQDYNNFGTLALMKGKSITTTTIVSFSDQTFQRVLLQQLIGNGTTLCYITIWNQSLLQLYLRYPKVQDHLDQHVPM